MTAPPPNSPNPNGGGGVPWCMCGCNGELEPKLKISLEREILYQPQDEHLDAATAVWAKSQVVPRPQFSSDEEMEVWIGERVHARLQHLESLAKLVKPGESWVDQTERVKSEEQAGSTSPGKNCKTDDGAAGAAAARPLDS